MNMRQRGRESERIQLIKKSIYAVRITEQKI